MRIRVELATRNDRKTPIWNRMWYVSSPPTHLAALQSRLAGPARAGLHHHTVVGALLVDQVRADWDHAVGRQRGRHLGGHKVRSHSAWRERDG